ncbi:MAG: ribonuclease H-like YkuK family protein, partial [Patescibacteria group bacterium]
MASNGFFHSQTFGICDLAQVRKHTLYYLAAKPEYKYRLVIGTDSQKKNGSGTDFVVAFIIHRVGAGGIYFWKRIVEKKHYILKTRMYQEAIYSLTTAEEFLTLLKRDGITKYDIEIHVDIGKIGDTREMI